MTGAGAGAGGRKGSGSSSGGGGGGGVDRRMFTARSGITLHSDANGLSFAGSRALIYSHVATEMLRRQLFHQVGADLARAILAQAGREAGFNDAQLMLQDRAFKSFDEMLEAQFAFLAAGGFGRFEILDLTFEKASRELYVRARCHRSPEAESHLRLFGKATEPTCCHLVGYSTGWSSAMTGMRLLTIETHCVAKGDDRCELETLPYDDFVGPQAAFWKRAFESTSSSLAQELGAKLATIEQQLETIGEQKREIAELSAPILHITDGIMVLPIIGRIDAERAEMMMEKLLQEVVRKRAQGVIIDLTGAAELDTETAGHISRMMGAIRIVGSRAVVTGLSAAMAQLLTTQSIELPGVTTLRSLHHGVRYLEGAAADDDADHDGGRDRHDRDTSPRKFAAPTRRKR